MKEIVDTNIFVRFLVADNESFFQLSSKWFKEAESGERELVVKAVVVAEVCFVLESVYKKAHADIASKVSGVLSASWLEVEDADVIAHAWNYYRDGEHFVDSFLLAWSRVNGSRILTFDKKLKRKMIL